MKLIDPSLGLRHVIWGGWILAGIGALKMLIYLVGEISPGFYGRFKSDAVRRFMTGNGNRLLFGLGGFLTIVLGLIFVFLGILIGRLMNRL